MAVMAPVHPRGHRTPALFAGSIGDDLVRRVRELGFVFEIVGSGVGAATAIKMVRSLFVKGLEAITVETLLAAGASGCLDYVLKSLGDSYPGLGFQLFQAVGAKDYPLMQGIFLVITISVLVANLLADLAYLALDPRTRKEV